MLTTNELLNNVRAFAASVQARYFTSRQQQQTALATTPARTCVFAFGDPEPVLNSNMIVSLEAFISLGGDYYTPPVDFNSLSRLMKANSYHGPILHFKKNMILKWFEHNALLSREVLERAALDYVVTGNAYFQKFYDRFGRIVRLGYLPSLKMRQSAKNMDQYVQLSEIGSSFQEFKIGEVLHLLEYDLEQGVYGVPQYLGGIQSILLSEASTLFRRKYFVNGAHLGYILVTNDANISPEIEKKIEDAIKDGKGAGNFRSLYMNVPKSNSREPVKVIPIGQLGSKDEYQAIKEVTEMEMLAMHRVPPNLAAIIPANTGGFGDLIKTLQAYHELEVQPLQQKFLQLNEFVPGNPVVFSKPDWAMGV